MNGLDAINKADEHDPDLIVLDLSMPIMNGLEAAEKYQGSFTPKTVIFILTSHGGPEVDRAAAAAGVDAVFAKGSDMDRLVAKARKAFAPAGGSSAKKKARSRKSQELASDDG